MWILWNDIQLYKGQERMIYNNQMKFRQNDIKAYVGRQGMI